MTFSEATRRVRTERKLTQAQLAAAAGLSRTQLVRIEGGLKPGPQALQSILGAFRFTIGTELLAAAGDADAMAKLAGYTAFEARQKKLEAKREREAARRPFVAAAMRPAETPTRARRYADQYWRGEPRPKRPSAAARGYGKAHRAMRLFILARGPWCVPGFPPGIHGDQRVPSTVADHLVSLRRGGTTTPSNMVGRCRACNLRKAIAVEGAGYQGRASARRIERQRWGAS